MRIKTLAAFALSIMATARGGFALGQERYILGAFVPGAFAIAQGNTAAPL